MNKKDRGRRMNERHLNRSLNRKIKKTGDIIRIINFQQNKKGEEL